jgi:Flp pilus assembly pilin Flp
MGGMKAFLRDEGGQAVVEYILAVSVAVAIAAMVGVSFRRTILRLWGAIAQDVTAACPGCPPESNIRFR